MEEKANAIIAYLKEAFPGIEVVRRESYNSSQKEIYEHHKDYFVILLDMSMHTFDRSKEESGGEPEPVAGRKILNGMYLRDIGTKVIVVTMYGSHEGKKLLTFVNDLKEEYPDNYRFQSVSTNRKSCSGNTGTLQPTLKVLFGS